MEQDYPGPERRDNLRYTLECPTDYSIRFCLSGSDQYQTSLSGNIGLGGILLLSSTPLDIGQSIDIEIFYHTGKTELKTTFIGQIIWVDEKKDNSGDDKKYFLGVQFDSITEEQNNMLINFIERYIMIEEGDEELIV